MKPIVIETRVVLPGLAGLVWDVITDWERQGDWMLEMSDVDVVSPHRVGVGVEALATVRIGGIRTRDRIRVDRWDPPRRLGIEHLGWVKGRGDLELMPVNGGDTDLVWRETLEPPWGLAGAIGLRLFRPLMARVFRRDLRALQQLVRARVEARYPENP